MKLLRIASTKEDYIDECLMIVPDGYNVETAVDESGLPSATIISEFPVICTEYDLDCYRPYVG